MAFRHDEIAVNIVNKRTELQLLEYAESCLSWLTSSETTNDKVGRCVFTYRTIPLLRPQGSLVF